MTPKRKFYKNGCQHIFQITVDRGLAFYTDYDCIVLFTIMCYAAVKYHVRITAFCIMMNHFHIQAWFRTYDEMELFVNELTSIFALMYNRRFHRKGQLFKKSYGNSPKRFDADILDNFIYISNNPVQKKVTEKAVEYRWNFLAYMDSTHPFSKGIDRIWASEPMKRAMSVVGNMHSKGKYLNYRVLEEIYKCLDATEREQLTDYIISEYNTIDYSRTKARWESTGALSEALLLVKGSEHDTDDDYSREDYRHYYRMNAIASANGFDPHHVRFDNERSDSSRLQSLKWLFIRSFPFPEGEVDKYLHLGEYSRRVPAK